MSWVLGIDLGTSYTAAGAISGSRLEPLSLGAHASAIPSAVYTAESGMVVGEAALVRGEANPTRLVVEFKRQLGDSSPILAGEQFVSAETLETALGDWVFRRACELEGSPPNHVVFTFPAFWGAYRRDLFLTLARDIVDKAEQVTLVTEPEAAAAFYASRDRLPTDTIVGVYDLGGGTFDASILQKTDGGFKVLGRPAGDDQLGGADLDRALLEYVTERAGVRWDELDRADARTARDMMHLRRNVILAKEMLSHELNAEVAVAIDSIDTTVRLTRREVEQLAEPMITRTIDVFQTALAYASVSPSDLHSILLVGAASRMPRIAEALSEQFHVPLALDSHPKFAICLGAAISSPDTSPAAVNAVSSPSPPHDQRAEPRGEPLPPPSPFGTDNRGWRRGRLAVVAVAVTVALAAVGAGLFFELRGGSSSSPRRYAAVVLASHPWGYWRLDEQAGHTTADSSGNGRTGTSDGRITLNDMGVVPGDGAATYDGGSGCTVIDTKMRATIFSLEAWFKTTTTHGGAIVAFNAADLPVALDHVDHDRFVYMHNDGRISFGVYHGRSVESTVQPVNDGKWHDMVAVIGPGGQKLYVDGALVASSPNTIVEPYDGYWHIGCSGLAGWPQRPASEYFSGTVDEAAVYATELTPKTIEEHFVAGSQGA
jgi:hypothetical protein